MIRNYIELLQIKQVRNSFTISRNEINQKYPLQFISTLNNQIV